MCPYELQDNIDEYFYLVEEIARLQKQADAIKDVVKFAMVEEEKEELSGPGWSATWHNTKTNRFDTAAFKKAYPEMYNKYCKTQIGTRFTLVQTKIKQAV